MLSSTCFDPEGSSSGGHLYVQVWYSVFYVQSCSYKIADTDAYLTLYHKCTCNCLPENESSGSKYVEYTIN
jgi:hypothetical protein